MQIYNACDFKEMPWKNGGGVTTELFCKVDQDNRLLFRISMAKVSTSGPFSLFPEINRALLLLSGNGFKLTGTKTQTTLTLDSPTLYFSGEEPISCELIQGECLDFNVMIHSHAGEASVFKTLFSSKEANEFNGERFFFFPKKNQLIHLQKGETFDNKAYLQEECLFIRVNLTICI